MTEGAAKVCKVLNFLKALSFTVMHRYWYGLPGAGWSITLIFMVLMVRPKLSLAVESLSTSSCISCSVLTLRAQSSAKRIRITVSLTLTPGVEQFPIKPAPDLDAGITVSECIGKAARKQHAEQCHSKYAAFIDAIGYEKRIRRFSSVKLRKRAVMSSWNWRMMAINYRGSRNLHMTFQAPSLLCRRPCNSYLQNPGSHLP